MGRRALFVFFVFMIGLLGGWLIRHPDRRTDSGPALSGLSTAALYEIYEDKKIRFVNDVILRPGGRLARLDGEDGQAAEAAEQFTRIVSAGRFWQGRGELKLQTKTVNFEVLLAPRSEEGNCKSYHPIVTFRFDGRIAFLHGIESCLLPNLAKNSEPVLTWWTFEKSDLSDWSSAIMINLPLSDRPTFEALDPLGVEWASMPIEWKPLTIHEYIGLHDSAVHEYNRFIATEPGGLTPLPTVGPEEE